MPSQTQSERCRICGSILSSYNKTEVCFHHTQEEEGRKRTVIGRKLRPSTKEETQCHDEGPRSSEDSVIVDCDHNSLTTKRVVGAAAEVFGVSIADLHSTSRRQPLATARQVVMFLLHSDLGYSLLQIGKELGRNHTTVLHGYRRIEKEIAENCELEGQVQQARKLYL